MAEEELKQAAYRAVKGASEWMVYMRNSAPLEGFGPWSDKFVDYKQGIMNTCEGLATMGLIDKANREENLHLPILDQNTLISDVKWLISEVEKGEYRGTPYMDYEDVENFTDAVSYALSTFIAMHETTKGNLRETLEKQILSTTNWFLSNKIEVEETYGWAWMGSEEMKKKNVEYPAQIYFTYSALIPLCDVLNKTDIIVDISNDIKNTIEGAKNFLIKYNREGKGWIAFKPIGDLIPFQYVEMDPTADLAATTYNVFTLCYIKNNVRSIEFNDDDKEIIFDAVEWMKKRLISKKDLIFKYFTKHVCTPEKAYFDGCAAYMFLEALTEFYRAYPEAKTKEDEKILREITGEIITNCWGGEGSGFKHFISPDPDSEKNILVTYATATGIEALLSFGVERPPVVNIGDIIKEELMNAQTKIFERLKESGIELEIPEHGGEEEEIISQEVTDNLNQKYDQMFMKISPNLTKKDLDTWATYGKDANVIKFLDLFAKNYNENDSETFKENISRFEEGHSVVLREPQKNALAILKKFTKEDIENKKERRKKMEEVLEKLNKDIEKFLKNKGGGA